MSITKSPSTTPEYQMGYRAGKSSRSANSLTPQEKDAIVREWLLEQRAALLIRKQEIDHQIAALEAEKELRIRGFVFPFNYRSGQ